jgi:hypothetical protein
VAGDSGYLSGVVRLDTADRDQRVAALGKRFCDKVFEFSDLVSTKGDARVAVLAFGPDFDLSAERFA